MIDADKTPSRRVYRTRSTLHCAEWCSVGFVGFGVLAAVPSSDQAQVTGLVLSLVSVFFSWRSWTVGIRAEGSGIVVVRIFDSKRFTWDEIDHFAVLPLGGYPYVGHVVLRSGQAVGTYGLGTPARPKSRAEAFRADAQVPVDELNQVLEARRSLNAAERGFGHLQPCWHVNAEGDRWAGYRQFRRFLLAMTAGILVVCIAIAVLLHTLAAISFAVGISLIQIVGTPVVLHIVRRDVQRDGHSADSRSRSP